MRAIVLDRYGPPDMLRLADIPRPEPGTGEVLVRVRATAVNDWDWSFVRGKPYIYRLLTGIRRPNVQVLGAELAGTVDAVGPGVTRFKPGDDVYGDVSEAGFGGFAEYACVREDALVPKPAGMSFEQAAAIPHAAGLALQGLVDVGGIKAGDRVLINGAGGGVGTIGVQLAKQRGAAEVTGVDSGPKLQMMLDVGFDHVVDYEREDFTRTGQQYDLILDTKTHRGFRDYLRALKPGGRYATVGGQPRRLLGTLFMGALVQRITGKMMRLVSLKPNKDMDQINELFETSGLEVVIDGPHPLGSVPWAVAQFGKARHLGKIVIRVAS